MLSLLRFFRLNELFVLVAVVALVLMYGGDVLLIMSNNPPDDIIQSRTSFYYETRQWMGLSALFLGILFVLSLVMSEPEIIMPRKKTLWPVIIPVMGFLIYLCGSYLAELMKFSIFG